MRRPEDEAGPDPAEAGIAISQELVTRFVAGDRQAFDQLFALLRQEVFRVVLRFFSSPFDQEEAFQEVWLQLHRMRGRFDVSRHAEFTGWARQVARNRCIDLLKARGRRPEIPVEDTEVPSAPSQLSQLAGARVRAALDDVLARLDAEQRRFFELCFVEELPHEEIATRMSITVRRSKYLKKKLLARLLRNRTLRGLL
jgi:RNA polymerase sigma factor (sigma-70 family)